MDKPKPVNTFKLWVMPVKRKKCSCGERTSEVWQPGVYISGKWRSQGWDKVCPNCWLEFERIVRTWGPGGWEISEVCSRSGYEAPPEWMRLPCREHDDCRANPVIGYHCVGHQRAEKALRDVEKLHPIRVGDVIQAAATMTVSNYLRNWLILDERGTWEHMVFDMALKEKTGQGTLLSSPEGLGGSRQAMGEFVAADSVSRALAMAETLLVFGETAMEQHRRGAK